MKKFKLSAMLIFMSMLVFSACGGGGGGGSDDPDKPGDNPGDDPKDPVATLEINGDTYTYTLPGGTVFKAMLTHDIATTKTFPCNIDMWDQWGYSGEDEATDIANVPARFIMGETEVTYELWYEVYKWATTDAGSGKRADGGALYSFDNPGHEGSNYYDGIFGAAPTTAKPEPVTLISWRDTIVWCNALTEYYNANNGSETDLLCVYTYSGAIIRDSRDSNATACDNVVQNSTAKGFRLPTSIEWEYAARYIGTSVPSHSNYVLKDGIYYSKGDSASGATADYNNASATSAVAVYDVSSTAAVKTKAANALGLYDMSGNVNEWCFDRHLHYSESAQVIHGGSFNYPANGMNVGTVNGSKPCDEFSNNGFRFLRNK